MGNGLLGRLQRLDLERRARAAGLPASIAERIAQVVSESDLASDRRAEVFRELVAHFEDGLAAGRTVAELLDRFGDGGRAAALIGRAKRVVTAPTAGGTGPRDGWILRLSRDLRYATRRLLARPVFTAIAVLSLALGIGANTAMFTLVNEVILRRPPLDRPEELVDIYHSSRDFPFNPLSYPDFQDLARETSAVFSGMAASRVGVVSRLDRDRADRMGVELVSGNYFEVLGLKPALGRLFVAADAPAVGQGSVVVLSHRYWRQSFAADPGAVGQTIRLPGGEYTIIGVTRPDFQGGFPGIATDLYLPLTRAADVLPIGAGGFTSRQAYGNFVQARIRPGVSAPRVTAAVAAVAASFREQRLPGWQGDGTFTVIPAKEVILFPPVDRILAPIAMMMMVVVGLVLVIACANLAGFLLARAVDRRKEIAVRLALGASRSQLVVQLLVETLLLALVGGAVGTMLGRLGLRAVLSADLPVPMPLSLDLTVDARVVVFSIAVSVLAGLFFGLAPALQSTRVELAQVIRDESTGGGRAKGALRGGLVIGQVAVAVVLLIVAGLFARSLGAARQVDPGFGRDPAALVWVGVPATRLLPNDGRTLDRLERRLAQLPGTPAVGIAENIHLNLLDTNFEFVNVDGIEAPKGEPGFRIDRAPVDTGFLAAFGLRLTAGRNFTLADNDTGRRVAIVNQAFADRFWPGKPPIGQRYRNDAGHEIEVVGLVNTAKIRTLAESPRPFVYRPIGSTPSSSVWVVVTGGASAETRLAQTLRTIRETEPDLLVLQARTMRGHIEAMSLPLRLGATAISWFAILALVLASIGLYGTVSYSVAQRSREVGIRLSLGADKGAMVRLLLGGGLRLVVIGLLTGVGAGLLFGRALESMLFGISALDPMTLIGVPVVLMAVGFVAAYLPARRAGKIDPVRALRAQ